MYTPTEADEKFFDEMSILEWKWIIWRIYIDRPFPFIEYNCLYDGWFFFDRNRTIRLHPRSQEEIGIFTRILTSEQSKFINL